MTKYQNLDLMLGYVDLEIFISLIQHQGIQNHCKRTRVVQLIHYSDLSNEDNIKYSWKSTGGDGKNYFYENLI